MKIILQQEVEKLGVPGDVVEVKDGYARNYLIPRGLAAPASKGGMRHAERLRVAHRSRLDRARGEAQEFAERLGAMTVRIAARTGEEGRLFGSVTSADIVAQLAKDGVELDRRQVRLDDPIRSVGSHQVQVHLHPEVNATLTVEVVPV